jgi:15-cis-phytoene synthase
MSAVYAFFRIADDISDQPGPVEEKRERLRQFRAGLDAAIAGSPSLPVHRALCDAMHRYAIPAKYLHSAIDGVEMDLTSVRYQTFADLEHYCYHVASVVGLTCIHIWGQSSSQAAALAIQAGTAFQLTNILRDLGEDAARGRIYLPRDDLDRFGYTAEELARGERNAAYRALLQFQVARAARYYDAAWPLAGLLPAPGRSVFLLMARTYRALLGAIEERDYDVFTRRVRVSRWRKLTLALAALPTRWGF